MVRLKKAVFLCWIRIMPIIAPKIFIILLTFLVANALDLSHQIDLINKLENTPISQIDCKSVCNISYNYQDQLCCTDDTLTNCITKTRCYPAKLQELEDQFADKKTTVILFSCILFAFVTHFVAICCIAKKWTQEIENEAQSEPDLSIRAQPLLQESTAEHGDDICVICLIQFQQTRVVKLNCGHLFHRQCINQWRLISIECPICKRIHE